MTGVRYGCYEVGEVEALLRERDIERTKVKRLRDWVDAFSSDEPIYPKELLTKMRELGMVS